MILTKLCSIQLMTQKEFYKFLSKIQLGALPQKPDKFKRVGKNFKL